MSIIYFEKNYAETLAQMRERFKKKYPRYFNSKITYAGRLDPMAKGIMLILTDQDVYKKARLLGLDKVYEVEFILGVKSDTYDILGLINYDLGFKDILIDEKLVKIELQKIKLENKQPFPAFSSRKVKGKPMWKLAREGKIEKIEREIKIFKVDYLGFKDYSKEEYNLEFLNNILKVEGDFRQIDIYNAWQKYELDSKRELYRVYKARLNVSSGTYIRSLINLIGERLANQSISLRINRTQLGSIIKRSKKFEISEL